MNEKNFLVSYELPVLFSVFAASYVMAMIIQVNDPHTKVKPLDWVLGLICSTIGGVIAYYCALYWMNIGFRIGVTTLASLYGYPIFKLIASRKSQSEVAHTFGSGLVSLIRRIFNVNPPQNNGEPE
jgi:MFS superfamily sulfate permease-like transporter